MLGFEIAEAVQPARSLTHPNAFWRARGAALALAGIFALLQVAEARAAVIVGATSALVSAAEAAPQVDKKAAQALLSPDETLVVLEIPAKDGKLSKDGAITGYKSNSYALAAPAGATLQVELKTSSTSAYFNIHDVRDQSGAAVHRGEVDGSTASIKLEQPGTYLLRPYLVRSAARRGETAKYTLKVSVELPGAAKAEGPAEPSVRRERVQFEKGASGATIKGQIKGDEAVDHILGAKAGQSMVIALNSDSNDIYFNVTAPDEDSALFIGSTAGNHYEGELPKSGNYAVRVYLMRPAGKTGAKVNYTLEIGVSGDGKSNQAKTENPTAPYTTKEYDATALIRSEIRSDSSSDGTPLKHDQQCPAGIRRSEKGAALIHIMKPDKTERILALKADKWTTEGKGKVTSGKQDDSWFIGIDNREFFIIPEAFILGD